MPLPRLRWRFRLRTLMIAVAVVAGSISIARLWARSHTLAVKARNLARTESELLKTAGLMDTLATQSQVDAVFLERDLSSSGDPGDGLGVYPLPEGTSIRRRRLVRLKQTARETPLQANAFREKAESFRRLRVKYEYAASHPWLPVPPDPPEPE